LLLRLYYSSTTRWTDNGETSPGNGYPIHQRLAEDLQGVALELEQLAQKEDLPVGL